MANELDHPRNVYVREDQILGPLDGWLAQVFDPGQLDTTLDALEAAASSTDDTDQAKAQAERHRVTECDTRLARYRAALEAGTDPNSGASSTEPVGESQCRRGDPCSTPTLVLRTELTMEG